MTGPENSKNAQRLAGAIRMVRDVSARLMLAGDVRRLRQLRRVCALTSQAIDALIDASMEGPMGCEGFTAAIKTSAAMDFANAIKHAEGMGE